MGSCPLAFSDVPLVQSFTWFCFGQYSRSHWKWRDLLKIVILPDLLKIVILAGFFKENLPSFFKTLKEWQLDLELASDYMMTQHLNIRSLLMSRALFVVLRSRIYSTGLFNLNGDLKFCCSAQDYLIRRRKYRTGINAYLPLSKQYQHSIDIIGGKLPRDYHVPPCTIPFSSVHVFEFIINLIWKEQGCGQWFSFELSL